MSERRGIPKNFTFDADAVELLVQMVPSHKGYWLYLYELVRNELIRQEERDRYNQMLAQSRAELLLKPSRLAEDVEGLRG